MPKVDLRMGDIQWPPKCCRCGSGEFSYRTRTENVVTRSVISATESQAIQLANVPVCDRCENARFLWFSGAIAAGAFGVLVTQFADGREFLLNLVLALFTLGVLLAIIGTTKSPIRIVRFDEKNNSLKIEIYNRDVAQEMVRREAGRQDIEGHAEYLEIQQEKQRKQDREVRLTVRTLCILGFASGLYLVIQLAEATGYSMMIMSFLFCLPFEIKYLRNKQK